MEAYAEKNGTVAQVADPPVDVGRLADVWVRARSFSGY